MTLFTRSLFWGWLGIFFFCYFVNGQISKLGRSEFGFITFATLLKAFDADETSLDSTCTPFKMDPLITMEDDYVAIVIPGIRSTAVTVSNIGVDTSSTATSAGLRTLQASFNAAIVSDVDKNTIQMCIRGEDLRYLNPGPLQVKAYYFIASKNPFTNEHYEKGRVNLVLNTPYQDSLNCEKIQFTVPFSSSGLKPMVFITPLQTSFNYRKVWIADITTTFFVVCSTLQSVAEQLNYMAFTIENNAKQSSNVYIDDFVFESPQPTNHTVCVDRGFSMNHELNHPPHIIASHSYDTSDSSAPANPVKNNGWIEFINEIGYRYCISYTVPINSVVNSVTKFRVYAMIFLDDFLHNTDYEKKYAVSKAQLKIQLDASNIGSQNLIQAADAMKEMLKLLYVAESESNKPLPTGIDISINSIDNSKTHYDVVFNTKKDVSDETVKCLRYLKDELAVLNGLLYFNAIGSSDKTPIRVAELQFRNSMGISTVDTPTIFSLSTRLDCYYLNEEPLVECTSFTCAFEGVTTLIQRNFVADPSCPDIIRQVPCNLDPCQITHHSIKAISTQERVYFIDEWRNSEIDENYNIRTIENFAYSELSPAYTSVIVFPMLATIPIENVLNVLAPQFSQNQDTNFISSIGFNAMSPESITLPTLQAPSSKRANATLISSATEETTSRTSALRDNPNVGQKLDASVATSMSSTISTFYDWTNRIVVQAATVRRVGTVIGKIDILTKPVDGRNYEVFLDVNEIE